MPSAKKVGFSSVNIKPGEQLRADRSWREAVLTQGSESASAKIMVCINIKVFKIFRFTDPLQLTIIP